MNIITRKKEIMEVIEKLNEATKLANDALTGLEELENSIESQKMFNQDVIMIDGAKYIKTDKEPAKGDYVVFEKDIMSMTKANTPYPMVGSDVYRTKLDNGSNCKLHLSSWVIPRGVRYEIYTKKPLTRKEVINKATDYIVTHTEDGYYFTNDERCCKVYFTHNREKRTSTLVLKGYYSGTIHHKETIKCHPDDAYNETIGKAILIARANNGTKMVELFENTPQPTEIKCGMVIDILWGDNSLYLSDFIVEGYNKTSDTVRGRKRGLTSPICLGGVKQDGFKIKDDSDVVY